MRTDRERIVVTGMGMVSPYGIGVPRFLEAVRSGEAAIGPIQEFDVSDCRCQIGARVPKLEAEVVAGLGPFRRSPRATQYAILATAEALQSAGQEKPSWTPERVGVFLGTYRGMTEVSEQIWSKMIESEPRFVPALLFQETVTNAVASAISIRWGFRGTNYAISAGKASGYHTLYLAIQALRAGRADAIVAGTFDLFTEANQHDMDALNMLSTTGASRPFDARRDGFVMGEGAAVVVLETLAGARARGATILAEIGGVGLAHDAHAFATTHPEGRGLAAAIRQALASAEVEPGDVDYIGAAANSTPVLDRAECRAIDTVFGERARTVPVSSLKALTGEAMAASDLFNLIACVAAVRDGVVPPQAGTEERDPECSLNFVRGGTGAPVRTALAHSYSYFGGNAAAAVVEACPN
jgi:3-oxoacyl-[acyl-carrier-protein] synthase II